ncbi:MAG: RIP metalloprotease RseP [Planctomycetota bacterium]|nr:RIP metalloprotease RseP [Planctomycetota bacterium]
MDVLLYIVQIVVGVSFIIFVHELGHFVACKIIGVKVRRFYLGFAPVIRIGKKKIPLRFFAFTLNGTEYGVGMLPLGGFVDMEGQDPSQKRKGLPDEFLSKKASQRALVFVAGSAMNALSAFLLFALAFSIGVSFSSPLVGSVEPGSPAWQAGFKAGDMIVSVDGVAVDEFQEFWTNVALLPEGRRTKIELLREGKRLSFEVEPRKDPLGRGMSIGVSNITNIIEEVVKESPAAQASIEPGWYLVGVEFYDSALDAFVKREIKTPEEFQSLMQNRCRGGDPVSLHLLKKETNETKTVNLVAATHPASKSVYRLGIVAASNMRVAAVVKPQGTEEIILRENDRLLEANGISLYSLLQLESLCHQSKNMERRIELFIERQGERLTVKTEGETLWKQVSEWVMFEAARDEPVCGYVMPNSPASRAGLEVGDRIVMFGGKKVERFSQLAQLVTENGAREAEVVWQKPWGEEKRAKITPTQANVAMVGIVFGPQRFIQRTGIVPAISLGLKRTYLWGKRVFLVLRSLFEKTVSPKHLSGPVGIFSVSFIVARYGIGTLIYFLALISINLAIVNLFPIPILDGGHLLFLGIEKIKGSPLSAKVQTAAQLAALVFLFALIIFVTYHDVARLWTMP